MNATPAASLGGATHLIFIAIFLLLSLADLRYRVVPGIEFVFLGAVFVAAPSNP